MVAGLAWAMGLTVLTGLPQIVWREILGRTVDPRWFRKLAFGIPITVVLLGLAWPPARALAGFSLLLLIQLAGYSAAQAIVTKGLVGKLAPGARALQGLAATGAFKVLPVALLAPILLFAGQGDKLFLGMGELTGRVRPIPFGPAISWPGLFMVGVAGTVAFLLFTANRMKPAHGLNFRNLIRFAPLIVLAAVVNAFAEEFLYRNAILPFLVPVLGSGQALWLSSIRFGLVHFYGTPPGVLGVLGATLFGLVLGYSMLETGGSSFAWALHIIADLVIFGAAAVMWRPGRTEQEARAAGARSVQDVELG